MADIYSQNSTQTQTNVAATKPNDSAFAKALADEFAKDTSGQSSGGQQTTTVSNADTGERTTTFFANIDTTQGNGNVSGAGGSVVLNLAGNGNVNGLLDGNNATGNYVIAGSDGQNTLGFTNSGNVYYSGGAGNANLGFYNGGNASVKAGTGDTVVDPGNTNLFVDLTVSPRATVLGAGGDDSVTLGNGRYQIDLHGGFNAVNVNGASTGYTFNLDATSGIATLTNASGLNASIAHTNILNFTDHSVVIAGTQAEATVARMYEGIANRSADADGFHVWIDQLNAGQTVSQVAAGFLASAEAIANGLGANVSNTVFLNNLYQNLLERAPDAAGLATWGGGLANGTLSRADVLAAVAGSREAAVDVNAPVFLSPATIRAGAADPTPQTFDITPSGVQTVSAGGGFDVVNFAGNRSDFLSSIDGDHVMIFSPTTGSTTSITGAEFVQFGDGALILASTEDEAVIARLYDGLLGRDADSAGLQTWWDRHDDGQSLSTIANSFLNAAEFQGAHSGGLTNSQFVDLLYNNMLGRDAEAAGRTVWESALASGTSRADVAVQFARSVEATAHNAESIHVIDHT
ncbi:MULTISPECIES: DUF4214 domain-containing protein [Methylobacterium]|uniref:DUF4214 domain-containing protein n=5 Tax=Pseudomonadota TaxID=1224 RepID=A0ABQ4SYF3_9HYPH|nr:MULTISPECIES: DUF4214 domain-containing protein [Methylobacterium]PIU04767.1 MAG: hypothetical protein COT56_18315 [Methylobacterium sp. CG09_land_8_20_14_0_10_71_15]PIU16243.1 MAG: hypothetical protein COT28_01100 [Methylobacterium sp. CG08_land_8_20_14_0_20_71_15]GBU17172.1 hypothetical protein AwMethylo_13870 [Methylobacterium sp.]GJE07912.1 hypothetical protein AOPFMNJM_3244 [Methylobacterium jeotgali]